MILFGYGKGTFEPSVIVLKALKYASKYKYAGEKVLTNAPLVFG